MSSQNFTSSSDSASFIWASTELFFKHSPGSYLKKTKTIVQDRHLEPKLVGLQPPGPKDSMSIKMFQLVFAQNTKYPHYHWCSSGESLWNTHPQKWQIAISVIHI
jgi:hypothetical protein